MRISISCNREGFTLIELLVVVSLIALLTGILLPALHHVRESANHAVCMSNQHQLGIALFSHAHDHGDKLPALTEIHEAFPTNILVCPSDPQPDVIPAGLFGNAEPLSLSYALNNEYEHYSVLLTNVDRTSEKAFLFDGIQATPGGDTSGPGGGGGGAGGAGAPSAAASVSPFTLQASATATATASSPFSTLTLASNGAIRMDVDADAKDTFGEYVSEDGKFAWITHVPGHGPGGNYEQARYIRIGVAGVPAHLNHGEVLGPLREDVTNRLQLHQSHFAHRHFAKTVGNVLMLDGHVTPVRQLEQDMFLNLDALFENKGGGGEGGNGGGGGGNGGGNGKGPK